MIAFLITLAVLGTLIVFGVHTSLYLHTQGAIGRYGIGRSRRVDSLAVHNSTGTLPAEDRYYMGSASGVYTTTQYARRGFLILFGMSVIMVVIVFSIISSLIH
jgi:hypothetical protein